MSYMTNEFENDLADFIRGQGLSLPDDFYLALGSAGTDSSFTEITGTGYSRIVAPRSLVDWAGTQGAGTTLASTGTSHATSNNLEADYGTAGSAWGEVTHVGIFTADSDDSDAVCLMYAPLNFPLDVAEDDPVVIPAGGIVFTLGMGGGLSNYGSNKLIDLIFRAQAYTWPATLYAALYTAAPSNSGGGTEVAGGSYARASIASSLAAWSGTQAPGSTSASSGVDGRISNNAEVSFPTPTANWGTVVAVGLKDASTLGNLLLWKELTFAKSVNEGNSAPAFPANFFGITMA